MQGGDRFGLDRIEYRGAACNRAGVPVLELAPGDEHERVLPVGALVGRNDVGRHELAAPGGRREAVGEHHRLTRIAFLLARIGDAALLFQPLPGDAGNRGHRFSHLVEHVRRATVVPVEPDAARDLLDDPQIGLGFARCFKRLASELHHAVGVGHGSRLLRPCRRRQDHVGEVASLGEEDLLHHQPVELGERLARVMHFGVRHRRVFAHDVHAADLPSVDRVHDLDYGEPGPGIECSAPQLFEARACLVVVNALIVREHHRDQPRVGGALHVVLTAQRVQTRARTTHLAGHQAQRDETPRVVRAVHVLGDAHAPQNHRCFRRSVEPRHLPDRFRRYAADRRHRLGTVARDVFLQVLEADGAALDEILVRQPFVHDGVHHGVEQRDIGVGLELQEGGRMAREIGAARIDDDQLGAFLRRVLDPGRRDRVIRRRVGADQEDHLGLHHIADLIRHRSRADAFEQRHDRGGVAQPRAVIHVVRAESGAHQLLEQIRLLVGALGRAETGERNFPVLVPDFFELACGKVERFFPARLAEVLERVRGIHGEVRVLGHPGLADEGLREPLLVMHVVKAVAAFDAQPPVVGRAVGAIDVEDLVVLDRVSELAADAAIRAHRMHRLVGLHHPHAARRHQCPGGAGLHALAAGDAGGITHRVVEIEHDLRVLAAERVADHVVHLLFAASAHAACALDARIEIDGNAVMRKIGLGLVARAKARLADLELPGPEVELRVEGIALLRHVGEQELQHHLLRGKRALVVGHHLHARRRLPAARGREHALAFDLDHAGTAVAVRAHALLVAQARNLDAVAPGGLDDGLAGLANHIPAVQLELDRHRVEFLFRHRSHKSPSVT